MNLEILLPFRIRNLHIRALVEEYMVRIRSYRSILIHEQTRTASRKGSDHIILLHPLGKGMTTEEIARMFRTYEGEQRLKRLAFGVGDAEGYFPIQPNELWSLSPCTFPHELVVLLLCEQIYRVLTLLHGHPYHR